MTRAFVALWLSCPMLMSALCQSAGAENQRGAQLAAICASCHRLDGQGAGMGSIVGLDGHKLTGLMQAFKSDESSNHIMHAVSLTLSDDEIATLAAYLAAQGKEAKQP